MTAVIHCSGTDDVVGAAGASIAGVAAGVTAGMEDESGVVAAA